MQTLISGQQNAEPRRDAGNNTPSSAKYSLADLRAARRAEEDPTKQEQIDDLFEGTGRLIVSDYGGELLCEQPAPIRAGRLEAVVSAAKTRSDGRPAFWPLSVRLYAADAKTGRDWVGAARMDKPE